MAIKMAPALPPKLKKTQEGIIERALSQADKLFAAGDSAQGYKFLELAMQAQAELIALAAPKKAVKSKSPPKAESEPDADDNDISVAPEPIAARNLVRRSLGFQNCQPVRMSRRGNHP